jgi:hypothetical protein
MGLRACLENVEKTKVLLIPAIKPRPSSLQTVSLPTPHILIYFKLSYSRSFSLTLSFPKRQMKFIRTPTWVSEVVAEESYKSPLTSFSRFVRRKTERIFTIFRAVKFG